VIEKLPDGRSLRSEFALVHGEIAEPDAVALSNNFEFGNARQEFSSRRIHDGRGGVLSQAYAADGKAAGNKRDRERETVRQVVAIQEAQMLAVGLKGEAFDKHVVTLSDGSRMSLGDMRRAVDVVYRDVDGAVVAAQAAGALRKDMTAAEKDVMRGRLSDTGAALNEGYRTGNGVPTEALRLTADDMDLVRHIQGSAAAPQVSAERTNPAPGLDIAPVAF
jgi:hypothetical protein